MPGTEASRLMAADIERALGNAAAIARLQEASDAGKQDRRDIWDNLAVLRNIAAQNGLILSKIDDLNGAQGALTAKLTAHEDKIDARLTAIERRDERGKGAMAVLLAIAGGVGSGVALTAQWALAHFWPAAKP